MAHLRMQLGVLDPVNDAGADSEYHQAINIFEGYNTIGRTDLATPSKQISRKHISIHASDGRFQVTVEGQNPIVLKKGNERYQMRHQEKAQICAGDILELLPGKHAFRFTNAVPKYRKSVINEEERALLVKRKRQEMEDESLARTLQVAIEDDGAQKTEMEDESLARTLQAIEDDGAQNTYAQEPSNVKGDHSTKFPLDSKFQEFTSGQCPMSFQLLKVRGLPNQANFGCLSIHDVIEGDILFALLSNYMIDLDWLLSACPRLYDFRSVVLVHGESGFALERLKAGKPSHWLLHKPPLPLSYGTHHSKAMILLYQTGVRVVVHTANLIYVDWNNKTQGLWMQDFPYKKEETKESASCFEDDLVQYLKALQWHGCNVHLPGKGLMRINADFFRNFDYTNAKVRLIASVPGYHQGQDVRKWGHMKLRAILEQQEFDDRFVKSPLVYQFSSLGSLDEKWLFEFGNSTSSGSTFQRKPLGLGKVQILWPTVEDVRWSIEGYAAGNAIPSPLKNVEKDFLRRFWARWHADHTGRKHAMPHFKSYIRYVGQDLAWVLVTSSNLSKAAWGTLQKNGSQLMIRSYELGVLFLPSLQRTVVPFSCTGSKQKDILKKEKLECVIQQRSRFVTTSYDQEDAERESANFIKFPVPYKIPLESYDSEDVPWSWDRQYTKPDTYGEIWPREVKLYGTKQDA